MAISAQDKILYVANKLGLSTLKDMQGSTGAVYDTDLTATGVLFGNASQHTFVSETNLNDNKFEVNSALLIESIAWYWSPGFGIAQNMLAVVPPDSVVVFDLIIGNKVVMKDIPVFVGPGGPTTFSQSTAYGFDNGGIPTVQRKPKHQVFMEGAGILIPPQVEFSINYSVYSVLTGQKVDPGNYQGLGAYLFGTRVLLNFNTSI